MDVLRGQRKAKEQGGSKQSDERSTQRTSCGVYRRAVHLWATLGLSHVSEVIQTLASDLKLHTPSDLD